MRSERLSPGDAEPDSTDSPGRLRVLDAGLVRPHRCLVVGDAVAQVQTLNESALSFLDGFLHHGTRFFQNVPFGDEGRIRFNHRRRRAQKQRYSEPGRWFEPSVSDSYAHLIAAE